MTDYEQKLIRLGFLEGAVEGIRLYATWKDGEQLVGCMKRPLVVVIEPYLQESKRITKELRESNPMLQIG